MSNDLATPNCDLLADNAADRDIILNFIDFVMQERGCRLGQYNADGGLSGLARYEVERLALEYLGVDYKALEAERQALLERVQKQALLAPGEV